MGTGGEPAVTDASAVRVLLLAPVQAITAHASGLGREERGAIVSAAVASLESGG
jgi:hypothetical protein